MQKQIFAAAFLACTSAPAQSWAVSLSPGEVYKKAGPAVVLILGSDGGSAGSAGTGSIISSDGRVITNAHVVINGSGKPFAKLYVFLKPKKLTGDNAKDLTNRYVARVVSFSPADELDLALLQIEKAPSGLPTIAFADPEKVEIGDRVVAIGHPESGGLWTLTTGTISTLIQNFGGVKGKDVFQTEASVNRGNSGGPLLDDKGDMLAINTMIARQGAGGVAITAVNFSLKSSVAVTWLAGVGMGLAYADQSESEPMVVASAETAKRSDKEAVAKGPSEAAPQRSGANEAQATPSAEKTPPTPPATIVVVESDESKRAPVESLKAEAKKLGSEKQREKVAKGEKLDPKKAKPTYVTEKRPIDLDQLRRQQMKELEDMMDEMRSGSKKKSNGMGLW